MNLSQDLKSRRPLASKTILSVLPLIFLLMLPISAEASEKRDDNMVYVKGGCYEMGDGGVYGDEKPTHEVCVDDFYIGKHEVKVSEFRTFVNDTGYQTRAERGDGCVYYAGKEWKHGVDKSWRAPGYSQSGEHPVVCVSWNDAVAYIKWKSRKTGQSYRFPTEAEWEYAARSGGKRKKYSGGNVYAGNIADERAKRLLGWGDESYDDGYVYTSPVGHFASNELGLYDMTGNVNEWVSDWSDEDYYQSSPKQNPQGPSSGEVRVFRGGAWSDDRMNARVAYRGWNDPDERSDTIGFRLALPGI